MKQPYKILIAKAGLDGHDRGVKVVARALRDAGMEVLYTGLHQTPEMIVSAAVQEDVEAVCLSILSGAHMTLFPRVKELLEEERMGDVLISGGGIIPEEERLELEESGMGRLFGPGTPLDEIVQYFEDELSRRRGQKNR